MRSGASSRERQVHVTPIEVIDTARRLVDLVLDIVPEEVAKQLLTDAAVKRANRIADLAEAAKFTRLSEPDEEP